MCTSDQSSGHDQQSINTEHHDTALSRAEHDNLAECEALIQRGQQTFLEVFPSTKRRRGTPERWTRGEIDARLWRACRRAGIREVGWHVLRHTFCSRLAAAGVPAPVIQRLAGHASITTTQLYMHLSPGMNQERDAIAILSSANLTRIAEGEAATGTN